MNIESALGVILSSKRIDESMDSSGVRDESIDIDLKRIAWLNFGPEVKSITYSKRKIRSTLLRGLKSVFSIVKHEKLTPEAYSFNLSVKDYEDGPGFHFEIKVSVDTIYEAKIPFTETQKADGELEVDLAERDVVIALKGFLVSKLK